MHQLGRIVGFLYVINGAVLLFSPGAVRTIVRTRAGALRSIADSQLEFGQLSSGALRLMGVWSLLSGAMLVLLTTRTAAEVKGDSAISPELHQAA